MAKPTGRPKPIRRPLLGNTTQYSNGGRLKKAAKRSKKSK